MAKVAPEDSDTTDVPLLKFESGMFGLMGESITTITFCKGDATTGAAFLKDRLKEVAASNPWICGTIVKAKPLSFLRVPTAAPAVDSIFEFNQDLKVSEQMDYRDLVKAVKKSVAYLPTGGKIAKTGVPVSRLTVVPVKAVGQNPAGFAVIFSMSHMIANGGTYTMIHNMIGDGKIIALNTTRKQELSDKVPEWVGKKHYAYMTGSIGNTLNAIGCLLFGKMPASFCFMIDDNKLKAAKEKAKDATPDLPDGMHISTNDVLTSGFAVVCKPRLLTMAMDFKGRIDGLKREDAGNYHAGIMLDPKSYTQPGEIRKAVAGPAPCSRASLPACLTATTCRTAIITSWAGFKGLLDIPGCTQTMHCPIADTASMLVKAQNALCIVFNPQPGRTAMLCCVKSTTPAQLTRGLPIEGPLSLRMWPTSLIM